MKQTEVSSDKKLKQYLARLINHTYKKLQDHSFFIEKDILIDENIDKKLEVILSDFNKNHNKNILKSIESLSSIYEGKFGKENLKKLKKELSSLNYFYESLDYLNLNEFEGMELLSLNYERLNRQLNLQEYDYLLTKKLYHFWKVARVIDEKMGYFKRKYINYELVYFIINTKISENSIKTYKGKTIQEILHYPFKKEKYLEDLVKNIFKEEENSINNIINKIDFIKNCQ